MKNSLERLKSKADHAKGRIMNLKDRSKKLGILENRMKKNKGASGKCKKPLSASTYM